MYLDNFKEKDRNIKTRIKMGFHFAIRATRVFNNATDDILLFVE